MSQLSQFLGAMQSGQEMSLESLWGTTITFPGQGNPGGYSASTGTASSDMAFDPAGVMIREYDRSFRVTAALLENDGVRLIEQQTHLVEAGGREYRIEKISRRASDGAFHLGCKQI